LNEKDVIQNFISKQQHNSVAYGIGDDCAVVNPSPGHQLVVTTDSMVEGIHFVKQSPAYEIGYKLMATNISDIASMCALPKWATLNLTIKTYNKKWLKNFSNGLLDCANQHNIALVGGDTTLGDHLVMSLQLIGEIPIGDARLRENAVIGDAVFMTGKVGYASQALKHLIDNNYQHSSLTTSQISALYKPPSRVSIAIALRHLIHACVDISDGLLHELEIICERSATGAKLMLERIPIPQDAEILQVITAGDDYELLFTADAKHEQEISQIANAVGCEITLIGHIIGDNSVMLTLNDQRVDYPEISGYDHFASS